MIRDILLECNYSQSHIKNLYNITMPQKVIIELQINRALDP